LAFRKALGYPPFTHLISLHVSGKNAKLVQKAAGEWAGRLKVAAADLFPDEVTIMGPIPAPVAQLRGRHRWQLLVKSAQAEAARQTVRQTLEELERNKKRRGLKFDVDVDPMEMS
jgi:primosomal protein N' (replication factor Y)